MPRITPYPVPLRRGGHFGRPRAIQKQATTKDTLQALRASSPQGELNVYRAAASFEVPRSQIRVPWFGMTGHGTMTTTVCRIPSSRRSCSASDSEAETTAAAQAPSKFSLGSYPVSFPKRNGVRGSRSRPGKTHPGGKVPFRRANEKPPFTHGSTQGTFLHENVQRDLNFL